MALTVMLLLYVIVQGNFAIEAIEQSKTSNSSVSSPWLKKAEDPRDPGCSKRPWICKQGDSPSNRKRCCKNLCVDVSSNVNNCGLCGIRCRFTWQCCKGFCINTNRNPFNCGRCGRKCQKGNRCVYGMCGYAQPPWLKPPFPFHPRHSPPFPVLPKAPKEELSSPKQPTPPPYKP